MNLRSRAALAATLSCALAATGCAKDPSKDVPAAKVEAPAAAKAEATAAAKAEAAEPAKAAPAAAPAPAPAPAPAAAPAGALALSGDILFTGSKVTGSHECKFATWSGTFAPADGKAEGGSLRFEVETASVIADWKAPNDWSKKLEGHLKAEDFFDVANHPKATFVSTEIKAGGEAGATHTVTGKLTIRGVTRDVTFPATIKLEGGKVTASAKFSINRKEFNIQYAGKPDDLIRDGVVLEINARG
jgi:polyisoprenoid-binding protein YceI